MKKVMYIAVLLIGMNLPFQLIARTYTIVKECNDITIINFSATELSEILEEIYPNDSFIVQTGIPENGDYILLGTLNGFPAIRDYVSNEEVSETSSFVVKNISKGSQRIGIICGNNSRGVMDGMYSLLEQKLGYGFYLTYNATENLDTSRFDFDKWDLRASPAILQRLTFNWHNFISGCSAWNYPEWKHWILQSARMRYTGVMIHTYGWSPLTEFTFNGQTKKVQYIQNTRFGSNWGVKHTDDVRTLLGGEVFDSEGPVFGADISKIGFNGVTMDNRVELAKNLMRKVSVYAKDTVGMDFIFSWDVDTKFCNDSEQIATLAPADRFLETTTEYWLARPDTDKGYLYYKAQVEMLLKDYPGITEIVLWFRHKASTSFGGLWLNLDYDELPVEWKTEYDAAPEIAKSWAGPSMLAISKVADAFQKAVNELGRSDINLGYGSWWFNDENHHRMFEAANIFFDSDLRAYFTDYHMDFGESGSYRSRIKGTGKMRNLTVIEWAHHDDGKYCGRPYTPPADLSAKLLDDVNATGFGVLHWMTRPLDIAFKNMQNQVWSNTLNEDLSVTIDDMAMDFFGPAESSTMSAYLGDWMSDAPQFNRETGAKFAWGIQDVDSVVSGVNGRLATLDLVDTKKLSDTAFRRWKFFKGHEEWIKLFYEAHESGDPDMQKAAIRKYVEKISVDGITRGEMGILVQHNLKWIKGRGVGFRESKLISSTDVHNGVYNIEDYGASGDRVTDNTIAIQSALDAAFNVGGGIVHVPAGTFKTGTIQLKSNVTLHIDKDATILGTPDTSETKYPRISPGYKSFLTRADRYPQKVLIYARNAENVAITGTGTIDGNGHHPNLYLDGTQRKRLEAINLIRFISCKNVRMIGEGLEDMLVVTNSGHWAVQPMNCDRVHMQYVRIEEYGGITPDGLPISDCRDVLVEDCYVSSDDDALGLKNGSPTILVKNITVKRSIFESANTGFKCGSPQSFGSFNNIKFVGCTFRTVPSNLNERKSGHYHGFFLGMLNGDGGSFEKILVEDCIVEETQMPFALYVARLGSPYWSTWWTNTLTPKNYGTVKDVIIRNLSYKFPDEPLPHVTKQREIVLPVIIEGRQGYEIENVKLENIYLPFPGGLKKQVEPPAENSSAYPNMGKAYPRLPAYGFFLRHVKNIRMNNVWIWTEISDSRPAIWTDEVEGFDQKGVHTGEEPENYVPAISFDNIADGATVSASEPILVKANARDHDGTITRLALYTNKILVSELTEPPYQWAIKGIGQTALKLKVEDNDGAASSVEISITITP